MNSHRNMSSIKRKTRSLTALAATATLLSVGPLGMNPASAAKIHPQGTVKTLVFKSYTGSDKSTLTLRFKGNGISKARADQIRKYIASKRQKATPRAQGAPLRCNDRITGNDLSGVFNIAYSCPAGSTRRSLPWSYSIHVWEQAIISGPIHERGMAWWQNGWPGPWNAPHTVPADYLLHGTLGPVFKNDQVDYNDYITFRHVFGGTGSITVAGSVYLEN